MKKILEILYNWPFVFLFGSLFGMMLTFILMKTLIEDRNTVFHNGYKKAQQECRQFIQNTNHN